MVGVAFAGGALGLEEGHARDDAVVVVFRPLAAEAVDGSQEAGVIEAPIAEAFADDALVLLLNVGVVVATACARTGVAEVGVALGEAHEVAFINSAPLS